MKLGSLFDGSGGFPLSGSLCGITPVWASEVEPYPIAVTRSRFPQMKHIGDVRKVNGANIDPVDIITFGSPCQDLSVAGLRKGLKHEDNGDEETTRSGLFMEAVRIIREMRKATNGVYPRIALWENVPGAFSSNKGEDFRIVLQELIRIVEPDAEMPAPDKNGWPYADCYVGDGWSVAYRTLDAQFWGVPQRRRRIYLVSDFAGERAGKILFERESLRGYFAAGRTPWQGTSSDAQDGARADDCAGECIAFHGTQDQISYVECCQCISTGSKRGKAAICVCYPEIAHTLSARHDGSPQPEKGNGANIVCYVAGFKSGNGYKAKGIGWQEEVSPAIIAAKSGTNQTPSVCIKEVPIIIDRAFFNQGTNALYDPQLYDDGTCPTIIARGPHAVCARYIVRRMTPTECARLQGFPDDFGHISEKHDMSDDEYRFWLDVRNTHESFCGKHVKEYTKDQILRWYNKLHTDSAEYKMWGNGIALPTALYVMHGIYNVLRGVSYG